MKKTMILFRIGQYCQILKNQNSKIQINYLTLIKWEDKNQNKNSNSQNNKMTYNRKEN